MKHVRLTNAFAAQRLLVRRGRWSEEKRTRCTWTYGILDILLRVYCSVLLVSFVAFFSFCPALMVSVFFFCRLPLPYVAAFFVSFFSFDFAVSSCAWWLPFVLPSSPLVSFVTFLCLFLAFLLAGCLGFRFSIVAVCCRLAACDWLFWFQIGHTCLLESKSCKALSRKSA